MKSRSVVSVQKLNLNPLSVIEKKLNKIIFLLKIKIIFLKLMVIFIL